MSLWNIVASSENGIEMLCLGPAFGRFACWQPKGSVWIINAQLPEKLIVSIYKYIVLSCYYHHPLCLSPSECCNAPDEASSRQKGSCCSNDTKSERVNIARFRIKCECYCPYSNNTTTLHCSPAPSGEGSGGRQLCC